MLVELKRFYFQKLVHKNLYLCEIIYYVPNIKKVARQRFMNEVSGRL